MTTTERIFKPELLPRRGEYTAWALTAASLIGLFFLALAHLILIWAWIFVILLLFSALSISLGNWIDRHTEIRLRSDGISFTNGLRNVTLAWDEIRQVVTFPARWGTTVQVIGENAHFEFNTLGEVEYKGDIQGKTGFAEGRLILKEIISACGLSVESHDENKKIYTRP